jgi:hypothetical protein
MADKTKLYQHAVLSTLAELSKLALHCDPTHPSHASQLSAHLGLSAKVENNVWGRKPCANPYLVSDILCFDYQSYTPMITI